MASKTPSGSPALEKAVAAELQKRFPGTDIHQDDFGHANWGVYIQLAGDAHAGAYALLSQTEDCWVLGTYTTDRDDEGIYFKHFEQLPATEEAGGGVGPKPTVEEIADAVAPEIKDALGHRFNFVRPMTADLAKALEGHQDGRGHHTFVHSNAFDGRPAHVFAMLDGTHTISFWLDRGAWRAELEDVNHRRDWGTLPLPFGPLGGRAPIAEVAAAAAASYEATRANLEGILAGWPEHAAYMRSLQAEPAL